MKILRKERRNLPVKLTDDQVKAAAVDLARTVQDVASETLRQVLAFAPDVADTPIKRVHTEGESAQFRKVWSFEVLDPTAVSRQFLVIDLAKIRAAVKGGIREIPGVRIFEEEQLAISGS